MAEQIQCRACGTTNPTGNNFCGQCGAFIGPQTIEPAIVLPATKTDRERRAQRQAFVVYAITALFLLTCAILAIVVIIWRP